MTLIYFIGLLFLIWLPFWTTQFAHTMSLSEGEYPAPGDKRRWFWVFIVLSPLAPFAYLEWRSLQARRIAEQSAGERETVVAANAR